MNMRGVNFLKFNNHLTAGFAGVLKSQNTILTAAFILSFAAGLNAFLGFIRGRLLATYFGDSLELSVFYTADKIPSFIYSLIYVGALSTVFIPVFTSNLEKDKNKDGVWDLSSSVISISMLVFCVISLILCVFAGPVINLMALGKFSTSEVLLGAQLMRIMLLSQIVLIFSSFIYSILQSYKMFVVPAIATILYSFGTILGVLFLVPFVGIYAPAYGVLLGSLLHLLIQLPSLKKVGFKYTLKLDFKNEGIREVARIMPARLLNVFVSNLLQIVNNSLAILVSAQSVVYLKFASQLQFFPISLFGLSIASAALPTLSEESGQEGLENFKKTFVTSLHQMFFLVFPVSVILLILRVPVVRVVYGADKFSWDATLMTAQTLGFFSISIFAQSANYLITRAFFALKDTITPVIISVISIIINVGLTLIFINYYHFPVWSIALSYSITSMLDMLALLVCLWIKVGGFKPGALEIPFLKISFSAILMSVSLYVPMKLLDIKVLDTSKTLNLLILMFVVCVLGSISYLIITKLMRVSEIDLFYKLLIKLRLNKVRDIVSPALAPSSPEL